MSGGLALIIQVSHTPRHVTPVQHEYQEKPTVHPACESPHRRGRETSIAVLPGKGYEYGLLHSSSKPPSMNNRGYRLTTGQVRVRVIPSMAWMPVTTSRPN